MKSSRLHTGYCLLLTGVFLAHTLFYFSTLGSDAVDDAYISFRYAQNAILGYGLVFNPTERVEGFTNFLWTVLFIPLEGLRVDTGRASMLLGALFGVGTLWLVVRFTTMVGAPRWVGWFAAFLLAGDGSFALWSVGGLETLMFAFLIFAGAFLYVLENSATHLYHNAGTSVPEAERRGSAARVEAHGSARKEDSFPRATAPAGLLRAWLVRVQSGFPLSGIFFALAAMTRPEGALVFAITIAHQALWRILAERRLFIARDLIRALGFIALFVPYWVGRWQYYHSFLPNSFHAKVNPTGPLAQIERGWVHLSQFVGVHLGWLIGLPAGFAVVKAVRNRSGDPVLSPSIGQTHRIAPTRAFWTTYFAALIIPYIAYIIYVGGDWSVGRFFVPLLAPFYILFSTGLVDLWNSLVERLGGAREDRLWNAGLVASALLVISLNVASSWNGEYGIYIRDFDAGKATLARVTMGKWLKANAPRGTLIAVDAAGQVPYFSGLAAVDMFGINDLHIGRLNVEKLGQGTPGHEKMDIVYVILRQPEYVIIYGDLFDSVKEYQRAPVVWTNDEALKRFLTLYRKKSD